MSGGLSATIPAPTSAFVGPDGNITTPWRAWLLVLQRRTGGTVGVDAGASPALIAAEQAARIAADNALQAAIAAEVAARAAADAAEASIRGQADAALSINDQNLAIRLEAEVTRATNAEALLVPIAQLCSLWAGCNLAFLPTSDPGGGLPWLDGGHIAVGTASTTAVDLGLEDGSGTWLLEDGTVGWVWG